MDGLGFLTCWRPWPGPLALLLPLMSSTEASVEEATFVLMAVAGGHEREGEKGGGSTQAS